MHVSVVPCLSFALFAVDCLFTTPTGYTLIKMSLTSDAMLQRNLYSITCRLSVSFLFKLIKTSCCSIIFVSIHNQKVLLFSLFSVLMIHQRWMQGRLTRRGRGHWSPPLFSSSSVFLYFNPNLFSTLVTRPLKSHSLTCEHHR